MCRPILLLFAHEYPGRPEVATDLPLKGIWYGSEPVVISLQLTHFQSLISLRMNHIIFREDPKT